MRTDRLTMSVLGAALLAAAACPEPSGAEQAREACHWIWYADPGDPTHSAPVGKRYFRRTFELPADRPVRSAVLVIAVDNRGKLFVNGVARATVEGWAPVARIALDRAVKPGRNVLAVEAANVGEKPNPAGLIARLTVAFGDGSAPLVVPTDAMWKASNRAAADWAKSDFDDRAWTAARVIAPSGAAPWGPIRGLPRTTPEAFPRFVVPGHQKTMDSLRELFHLHYGRAGPKATLWDGWLAKASLWPATKSRAGFVAAWRRALLGRKIDAEGYVSTHQHRGLGHNDGWPFPCWTQVGGKGWHFSTVGQPYRVPRATATTGWVLAGARSLDIDPQQGWRLRVTGPTASITTPPFKADTFVAPFIRLGWSARGLEDSAKLSLEWTTAARPEFSPQRTARLPLPARPGRLAFSHAPLWRHRQWEGTVTRLRLRLTGAAGATVTIQSLITAVDTRHNINNTVYIQGCDDYLNWTGDLAMLRENVNRMRRALRYAMREFGTREHKCVVTPWVGHDGRSGLEIRGGRKIVHRGRGVGNNYWDLLPFGGKDALATIYYYDAVNRLAAIEQHIADHPEWRIPDGRDRFDPADLRRHAQQVKAHASKLFWNAETGRFVAAVDADGKAWDYGFSFVNCEAIYYGFATKAQARAVVGWLSGRRTVEGDTSRGADIYHWRFGPRATTKRNVEYYVSVWTHPEHIPWGGQVQDGGAVLGFSYYDLMSRLATNGPDDAWRRLRAIVKWFDEVQQAGGYRAYYKTPGRGTLQGGGTAGGLGLDREFFESVLVPQVMLYGFLGFRPGLESFAIDPRLPKDWPELTVSRIGWHGQTLTITAAPGTIRVRCLEGRSEGRRFVYPPVGRWQVRSLDERGRPIGKAEAVTIDRPGRGTAFSLEAGGVMELTRLRSQAGGNNPQR